MRNFLQQESNMSLMPVDIRWDEIGGGRVEAITTLLRASNLRGAHLEIGTAEGKTLKAMMLIYDEGSRPRFTVVDTFDYFPGQLDHVKNNLRDAGIDPSKVDFRVGTSWNLVEKALANKESYSFIFIDAVHSYLEVTQDLRWTRMLERGGYVCIHDYKRKFPGVKWAVRWFLWRNQNYRMLGLAGSLAILHKSGPSRKRESGRFDLAAARAASMAARFGHLLRGNR
jgi:predicted O-methyltransferase YrrM